MEFEEFDGKPRARVKFENDLAELGVAAHHKGYRKIWFSTVRGACLWLSYSSCVPIEQDELKRYVEEGCIRQFDRLTLGEMAAGGYDEKALFQCSDFERLVGEKYPATELLDKHLFLALVELQGTYKLSEANASESQQDGVEGQSGASDDKEKRMKTSEAIREWMRKYAQDNGITKGEPMSDEQLKAFRESASIAGIAPSSFNTNRRIEGFLGRNRRNK